MNLSEINSRTTASTYPFGSVMPGRAWSDASRAYRYGFNGKEKDFETAIDNYDFGARIYDGRLGRWLSLDPLMKKYPSLSAYSYCNNEPVLYTDAEGRQITLYDNVDGKQVAICVISKDGVKFNEGYDTNNQFYKDFESAKSYLSTSSKGKALVDEIINSDKNVDLNKVKNQSANFTPNKIMLDGEGKTTDDESKKVTQEYAGGNLAWDPNLGLTDAEGNYHSPAMVLAHELFHVQTAMKSIDVYENNVGTKLSGGQDTKEEKEAIGKTNEIIKEMENKEKAKKPFMSPEDPEGTIYDGHTVGKEYRIQHINGSNVIVKSPTSVPNKTE